MIASNRQQPALDAIPQEHSRISAATSAAAAARRRRRRTTTTTALAALAVMTLYGISGCEALVTNSHLARPGGPHPSRQHRSHFSVATKTAAASRTTAVPPSLSQLNNNNNENTEFELQLGRALDTLRADYPHILTDAPSFDIYATDLSVVDPSGVHVHGLTAYKNAFRILHALVKLLYCPSASSLQFKMCFDCVRQSIRISWNAHVVPREIFGGSRKALHVDGISVYELDRLTGLITEHRIEHLLMNNSPVQPKEGVIAALNREHTLAVPSFCKNGETTASTAVSSASSSSSTRGGINNRHPMRPLVTPVAQSPFSLPRRRRSNSNSRQPTALFSASSDSAETDSSASTADDFLQALEAKNKSRLKFGMKPLTVEEFMELQAAVEEMDGQQKQKQAAAAAATEAANSKKKRAGLFDTLLKNTCESNFDCQRPEVCCDFGFKKMCCSSGALVGMSQQQQQQGQMAPVPVVAGYPKDVRDNY